MKTNILLVILLFVNVPLCLGEINEELSHFIYALPVMEGMELIGTPEEEKMKISDDIEIAIVIKVLNSKEGQDISAEKIGKYYYDHFVSLKFNPWQKETVLTGRYLAPRLVTQGSAYIWSQGHISFWIPKEGNSVTFCLHQRREFNIRQSQETIDQLSNAFEAAAGEFGYAVVVPSSIMVSDWPKYLENECFVDRIVIFVRTKEAEGSSRGDRDDNGSYMFYFSVFPTARHAEQWRDRIVEENEKAQPSANWFKDGLGLSPRVIKNIVIEYKGAARDQSDPAFRKRLMEELDKIDADEPAAGDGI